MRKLSEIAAEIKANWVGCPAVAYIHVAFMAQCASIKDSYLETPAEHSVRGFLANAHSWRGPAAKRIKEELADMLRVPA